MGDQKKEIITNFFESMILEFQGCDNGTGFVLSDYDVDYLRSYFEFYISKLDECE